MNSAPDTKVTEPDDALIARADERLAHAYEQIAHADEQLARVTEQLSKLERDAARQPSAVPDRRPPPGGTALRGFIGLLLAACIFVAAFASQSYGDAAKLVIARWVPQLVSTSSPTLTRPELLAQASASGASASGLRMAAAEPTPPQSMPSVQPAPQDVGPTAALTSPDLVQMLQTITRDLANVEQGIEQLKASQAQMAGDNAKAVEQLRASQDQMARVIARLSEQSQQSRITQATTSAPPPRQIAPAPRKPAPAVPSQQTRARPQ
jgi:hypothetical protein